MYYQTESVVGNMNILKMVKNTTLVVTLMKGNSQSLNVQGLTSALYFHLFIYLFQGSKGMVHL